MRRTLSQIQQGSFSLIVEEGAQEEVSTRVACDGELREGDDLYPLSLGLQELRLDATDIVGTVSHPHKGNGSCYLDKSILHIIPFFVLNHLWIYD